MTKYDKYYNEGTVILACSSGWSSIQGPFVKPSVDILEKGLKM